MRYGKFEEIANKIKDKAMEMWDNKEDKTPYSLYAKKHGVEHTGGVKEDITVMIGELVVNDFSDSE